MEKKRGEKKNQIALADTFSRDPFGSMRKFNNFFNLPMGFDRWLNETIPDVDILDERDKFRIKVDLPGAKKDDITINVTKDSVVVKAATQKAREEKREGYYYRERSASGYYRSIPLPVPINDKSATAKFEDGTLEIIVKKLAGSGSKVKIE